MKNFHRSIKIVHLVVGLETGGMERMLANLVLHTDPRYIDTTVIVLTDYGTWGNYLNKKGVKIIALNLKFSIKSFFKLFSLWKIILRLKPDILQTWMYYANFIGVILGKTLGVPIVLWNIRCANIDVLFLHQGPIYRIFFKLVSCFSNVPTAILVNSYAGKQWHKQMGYKAKAWVYMPNGFDTNKFYPSESRNIEFRRKFSIERKTFIIGMIARYDVMKNYTGFLQGTSRFIQHYSDVKFVLVGRGVDNENIELKKYLEKSKLENNFIFLGERTDIEHIMPALDVLTLFSFSEGFPNVLGEAMSSGVICVSTDVGEARKIIGDTGFIIPNNDIDALVGIWEKIIIMNKLQREKLSVLARKRILENYELTKTIDRYQDFYQILFDSGEVKHNIIDA